MWKDSKGIPMKTPIKRVHSAYPPGRGGNNPGNNQGGGGKGGPGGNPGGGGGGGGKGLNSYNPRMNTLTGKSIDGISSVKGGGGGGSQYHAPGGN